MAARTGKEFIAGLRECPREVWPCSSGEFIGWITNIHLIDVAWSG